MFRTLWIPFRQFMLLAGLAELLVAFICLFTDRRRFIVLAIAWVSTNFVAYRLGLWFIGWLRPCGCTGNLTDLLHTSPQVAANIMKCVLACLLIGSYLLLIFEKGMRATFALSAPFA